MASVGLLAGLTGVAIANTTLADSTFAREAAFGGMAEVELGKIAVQKASNEKVREFGQRMVDDHARLDAELKGIAAKDNIELPNHLDAKYRSQVDRFSKMSAGSRFDSAYIDEMISDHRADLSAFEKEQDAGQNHDLTGWVADTLPTLRDHLRMAEAAQRVVGIGNISSLRN